MAVEWLGRAYSTDGDLVIGLDLDRASAETASFGYIRFGGTAWRWRFRIPMETGEDLALGMHILDYGDLPFEMPFPAASLAVTGSLRVASTVTAGDNTVNMRSNAGAVALKRGTPFKIGNRVYASNGAYNVGASSIEVGVLGSRQGVRITEAVAANSAVGLGTPGVTVRNLGAVEARATNGVYETAVFDVAEVPP